MCERCCGVHYPSKTLPHTNWHHLPFLRHRIAPRMVTYTRLSRWIVLDGASQSLQDSEQPPVFFSSANAMRSTPIAPALVDCFKTYTTEQTHDIVRSSREHLPLYESGDGEGLGPRYCPSLPSKVGVSPVHTQKFELSAMLRDVFRCSH